jgi:formiminotetrahydrofolate cyclodeaminase
VLSELNITEFLSRTASSDPVPGGGSVSALGAAVAAALSEMVASITIGRKGFETYEKETLEIVQTARRLRTKLVEDIDRDSDAYAQVLKAYRLPNDTQEQKNKRSQAIQDGLKQAALIPLGVAKDASELLDLAEKVVVRGNKNAITDAAVAAMMARGAILGALLNVKINLKSIKDISFVKDVMGQVTELESRVESREKNILDQIDV